MAWVSVEDVSAVLHIDLSSDEWILHDIEHVQGLCEVEIGTQTEPITARLKAVAAQIVARIWRAGEMARHNPEGLQQESLGSWSGSYPPGAGLGLTNAEKRQLRKAIGLSDLGVITITRGSVLETAGYVAVVGQPEAPFPVFADEDLP